MLVKAALATAPPLHSRFILISAGGAVVAALLIFINLWDGLVTPLDLQQTVVIPLRNTRHRQQTARWTELNHCTADTKLFNGGKHKGSAEVLTLAGLQ